MAQQANGLGNQQSQAGWNSSSAQSNQQWQAPQQQGQDQWQPNSPPGQWQPINNQSGWQQQAGPSSFGTATATQVNGQYQEPGAYLNRTPANNGFNDTASASGGAPSNSGTADNGQNQVQQGHVHKSHEGLKYALSGVGKALELGAAVAGPMAGGYMMGKAMSAGYGAYPYGGGFGMPGFGMPGYGFNPYGMGMPMMNPGMSSFLHY